MGCKSVFKGLNINISINAKMSIRLYPTAVLCKTHTAAGHTLLSVLKASDYVKFNLSGNFEMRDGAFGTSAVIFLMNTIQLCSIWKHL
jgi:hypothetical protein